jgi:hypothetical protein
MRYTYIEDCVATISVCNYIYLWVCVLRFIIYFYNAMLKGMLVLRRLTPELQTFVLLYFMLVFRSTLIHLSD